MFFTSSGYNISSRPRVYQSTFLTTAFLQKLYYTLFLFTFFKMSEPQWFNVGPLHVGSHGIIPLPIRTPKVHLLSSYFDDAHDLLSSKAKDAIELPVLTPDGPIDPFYKVVIPRRVHEELENIYMIKHDPVHEERRYTIWIGFDLDRFGPIKTPARFFQALDMALLSEKVIVQDTTALEGRHMPNRAVWMAMYGYFGNWYKPEERKWAILAAKRHIRLLKKLHERADLRLVDEKRNERTCAPSEANPEIVACWDFTPNCRRPAERYMIFPELFKEKYKMTAKGKESEKHTHGCAHA